MNTQNIATLSAMLIRAGFEEGIGYRLLQRVCFTPSSFTLFERLKKNKDTLTCSLHFERQGMEYVCGYYDVSLIKGIVLPERTIDGIDLEELDKAMGQIDWCCQADGSQFRLDDPDSWAREKNISQIVSQLTKLSATVEGKHFADALRLKHWMDAGLEDLVGNLNVIRARIEISQRVYFIDGEGIPIDEVHRFLLNRWMEKKMQANRRERANESKDGEVASPGEERGKQFSSKKRKTTIKRIGQER
ncbi:hypothetical protein SAMN05444410_10874 [Hydrobacter penzbergensis]|uniref:Uncharacterized protein n=1 Tax=Hydrobacter penzbergensis TaxID=1235997 RepID=A0A8X8IFW4_9BACT|nr:hypothetical protein [Hydrobacter penzbergensis]SDX02761.1 hypothetical protein SAMN05444410_10874 [Hydrobacter penzbergensis]